MQQLKIHVVTYNVANDPPAKDLNFEQLMGFGGSKSPDIIIVGLQEGAIKKWSDPLAKAAKMSYVKMKEATFVDISIFLFVKMQHLPKVKNIAEAITNCGYPPRRKGASCIRAEIFGADFCFICSHLEAHEEETHNKERIEHYKKIMFKTVFNVTMPDQSTEKRSILEHDFIFWLGDLNFRLTSDVSRDEAIKRVKSNIPGDLQYLLKYDQLQIAKDKGEMFLEFEEGEIKFKPTFKYDKNTQNFDTSSKQRKPAWCDRILVNDQPGIHQNQHNIVVISGYTKWEPMNIKQSLYTSLQHFTASDHRPVIAEYTASLYPPYKVAKVDFGSVKKFKAQEENAAQVKTKGGYKPSEYDYLALYEVGVGDLQDGYATFEHVNGDVGQDGLYTHNFSKHHMDVKPGSYRLMYCSTRSGDFRVLAVSNMFEVESPTQDTGSDEEERGTRMYGGSQGRRPTYSPQFLEKESLARNDGYADLPDSETEEDVRLRRSTLEELHRQARPSMETIREKTCSILRQYCK